MKLKLIFLVILAAIVLIGLKSYRDTSALKSIDSYESCIAAQGSRIQESYPATCVTTLGARFTQPILAPLTVISSPTPQSSSKSFPAQLPSPTQVQKYEIPSWISLQSTLTSNCRKYPFGNSGGGIYGISHADLPFKINTSILEIYTGNILFCTETVDSSRPAYGAAYQAKLHNVAMDWKHMYLYNDDTITKFGTDTYGLKGTGVGTQNDIAYSIYFSQPNYYCSAGSPQTYFIDSLEIIVRAEKKFTLSNGENLYMNVTATAITPDNERLRNLLSETASPCSSGDSRLAVATQDLGNKVKERFFGNLKQLSSPEKEAVNVLTELLNTVTLPR